VATPNYGYEKRQKELAKKRKKEEKLKSRAERGPGGEVDELETDLNSEAEAESPAAKETE
jgi:hypothetical protein